MVMPPAVSGSETFHALIAAIATGDRDAFSRFYDLAAPLAYGLIRRVLRDPDAAAEVLQEVFWQVWKEAAQYDPKRGSPVTPATSDSTMRSARGPCTATSAVTALRSVTAQPLLGAWSRIHATSRSALEALRHTMNASLERR